MRTDSTSSNGFTERAEEILCAALELTSSEERAAFVHASCAGDVELQATVDGMLCSQPAAENFFKRSMPPNLLEISRAVASTCGFPVNAMGSCDGAEDTGKQIGPYTLLQKIGEGGCGVVYLAEQQIPIRRRVALKIIKLGMDTKRVIARFEAERQALALMDHLHIACVLDAGATQAGRPYFVMELVRGVKITKYCDEHRLDLRARLELFIQVCHAIQHAHQKGIIHRDIKPSNILVTNHNGMTVPKVIDFGIAKATSGGPLTDKTLLTAYEQFVGTPAYMSPEQAQMGNVDVDTRSDIYSLGVLLYEILIGKTPFEQNELLHSGLDQMRHILREHEPHPPSAKLGGLGKEELTETASLRRVEPRKLKSLLTGDLDWIVMKALEKDRSLRYQTANGLGVDVQRYLNNEPVVARPPNQFYRFRKLIRRNKALFAAISCVSLALLLGFTTSSWLFVQEREAHRQQVSLREDAERARASETRRRVKAETNAKIAEAAVLITRKKMDEADRLVEGIEISSIQPSLEAAGVFRDLGCWNVTKGGWEEAANRFLKKQQLADAVDTSDLTDNATRDLPAIAIAFIVANHLADYRRLMQQTVTRFAKTDNPIAAEHVLKISTYLPNETNILSQLEPCERLAEKSLADEPNASPESQCMLAWRALAVSMYYYRYGNFPSAAYWARRCLNYTDTAATRAAMAQAVLAMAEHHLNPADGGAELEAARVIVDARFPGHIIGVSGIGNDASGFWNDWIAALLLYQEADREMPPGIKKN